MGGVDHGCFLRGLGNEILQIYPFVGIESHRGFIQQQELGIVKQSLGNADPLPHPAGVAGDMLVTDPLS